MTRIDSGLFSRQGTPIPLLGVRVEGEIAGQGAGITVSQRFRNVENQAIEAVYKFPLPEGAAVCGFSVEKGDSRISGRVEERDKAFEIYDDALQEGKGGYLLDEERPNIFTLSIGNLNPGMEAVIHMDYVTLMDGDGDALRLLLPMTITPRYIPDHQKDDGDIPLDHRLHPPYAQSVPYGMEMRLTLSNATAFSAIESPSHPIRIEQLPDQRTTVSFAQESVQMDRDFILTLTLRDPYASQAWVCRDDREAFLQLDFFLEKEEPGEADGGEAVFFVVDCSGSMEGDSIHEARQALDVCLKALDEGTQFNVLRFGSRFESLFPEPKPYSEATLNTALAWSKNMQADLGGTEILRPLKHVYKEWAESNSRNGSILLLTDGAVGNEDEVISLVRGHTSLRMFPIGIGAGCNEAFIKGLARAGKGASAFIYPGERMGAKILRLFVKISEQGMEPAIDWGNGKADQAPADPVIYTGGRTTLFARIDGTHEPLPHIVVRGTLNGHAREWPVPVSTVPHDHPVIPLLWAREKIRELENVWAQPSEKGSRQTDRKRSSLADQAIELSKAYGILSRHTSFVAVEEREEKDLTTGEALLRKVPVPVTMGWHGLPGLRHAPQRTYQPADSRVRYCIVTEPTSEMYSEKASLDTPTFLSLRSSWRSSPRDNRPQIVMAILSQQRANGGFVLDDTLTKELNICLSELIPFSQEITPSYGLDSLTLLWSAVLLQVLEQRFPEHRKTWEKVVKKTRKWVEKTIKKHKLIIQGEPLLSWAARYVSNHRMPAPST